MCEHTSYSRGWNHKLKPERCRSLVACPNRVRVQTAQRPTPGKKPSGVASLRNPMATDWSLSLAQVRAGAVLRPRSAVKSLRSGTPIHRRAGAQGSAAHRRHTARLRRAPQFPCDARNPNPVRAYEKPTAHLTVGCKHSGGPHICAQGPSDHPLCLVCKHPARTGPSLTTFARDPSFGWRSPQVVSRPRERGPATAQPQVCGRPL